MLLVSMVMMMAVIVVMVVIAAVGMGVGGVGDEVEEGVTQKTARGKAEQNLEE